MLRSSRLAVFALAVTIFAAPAAMASPPARTAQPVAKSEPPTAPVASPAALTVTLHRFETMADRIDVSASAHGAAGWGHRAQQANQKAAFDRAFASVMRHGDFRPGSFSESFLFALVDYAGADNVRDAARSFRLRPERYRDVLQAINARNRSAAG